MLSVHIVRSGGGMGREEEKRGGGSGMGMGGQMLTRQVCTLYIPF